jgi:hypothetical protein
VLFSPVWRFSGRNSEGYGQKSLSFTHSSKLLECAVSAEQFIAVTFRAVMEPKAGRDEISDLQNVVNFVVSPFRNRS